MKKGKHLLIVIAILCLAIALVPSSSASADDVTVSIDAPAEVNRNTDFIARVNITEVTNFDAANYDITYNPIVLEVTDVTDGIIGETVIPVEIWGFIPAETQGKIRVVQNVSGFPGVSGTGCLAEIHFHVVGSAGNTSGITMSNGMLSDNTATEIPAIWAGDSVHVRNEQGGGGGGGGGGGSSKTSAPKLEVDIMGKMFSVSMTNEGVLEEALEASSLNGAVTLRIAENTQALDSEGDHIEKITITAVPELTETPEKVHLIGVAYEFAPENATFTPELELTMRYDPEGLPEGISEDNLLIAWYQSESGQYVYLPSEVDTVAHTVTVRVSHFSVFAIVVREEATFHFAEISVFPTTVDGGENVTISAEVTNIGGMEGSCTVTLLIDGIEEATQEMTLAAGASETVTFSVTRDAAKTYSVQINELTGEFAVVANSHWAFVWGIGGGILGILAAAAVAVYFVVLRRRKAAA